MQKNSVKDIVFVTNIIKSIVINSISFQYPGNALLARQFVNIQNSLPNRIVFKYDKELVLRSKPLGWLESLQML